MQTLEPSKDLIGMTKMMLTNAWSQRLAQSNAVKAELNREIAASDTQLDALLDRIVDANNPTVIAAYEKKIANLEQHKLILAEKVAKKTTQKRTPEQLFELAVQFLSNPWNIWSNGDLTLKKTVLRLVFKAPLTYDRQTGLRTPQTSVIFRFLDEISLKSKMVHPARFERATP